MTKGFEEVLCMLSLITKSTNKQLIIDNGILQVKTRLTSFSSVDNQMHHFIINVKSVSIVQMNCAIMLSIIPN